MAIKDKLTKFAFVTVFNAKVYEASDYETNGTGATEVANLDSLSVSNFTQEGPNKTAKGGLYANTLLRYGKTMRLEMEDVIGKLDSLKAFMGVEEKDISGDQVKTFEASDGQTDFDLNDADATVTLVEVNSEDDSTATDTAGVVKLTAAASEGDIITVHYSTTGTTTDIVVTDKFAGLKAIVGETFLVDDNGNKNWINVVIPKFLPDSIFNQTMEAEGDFGVISIAGDIQANDCGEFYYFTDNPNSSHTCN
jgi:hypothetical protein